MRFPRASGVLLHPTSLPGRLGIGELGEEAYRWVDFLVGSQQRYWQVLPLGPTGYGDSPYQCFSAFAGNPLLISLERLVEIGLLDEADLADVPPFPSEQVDYGWVIPWKFDLLKRSFANFQSRATRSQQTDFYYFCQRNASWLDDFALFMALKDAHQGAVWSTWEPAIVRRQGEALAHWKEALAEDFQRHQYLQYQFFKQWWALKEYANQQGVQIIGDIPIFVAYDSADVWAHPELFYLDEAGHSTVVAGVPPDYFSATGQLWGNPLYRWDVMASTGYAWWIERFKATLTTVDIIRLDHFRGFEAYWEVPASESTAVKGRWVKGPGVDFFSAIERALGHLPIIAEDLGVITPPVVAMREQFDLPGMKILQFAFATGVAKMDKPYGYPNNCVVYTGTHDNDTTLGWFTGSSTPEERAMALKYLGTDGHEINWDFIRLAWSSVADTAMVPLQDLLGLDTAARMNYPSRASGNWTWRFTAEALTPALQSRLAELTEIYGRAPEKPEETQAEEA